MDGASTSLIITSVSSNKGACRSAACQLKLERTRAFVRSVRASNLHLAMLGNSSSWRGWLWMALQYEEHAAMVSRSDPESLLVAMDSSDGIVQASSEAEILAAYRNIVAESTGGGRLVMALETGCIAGFCVPIPSVPTPAVADNIHVNGGFVIGPARLMRRLWHDVAHTNVSCCHKDRMHPQLGMGKFALLHPELVTFDTHQRLAAVINLHSPTEWNEHYRTWDGIVVNRHTSTRPAFLHFPGQQFASSWSTYRDAVLRPRKLLSLRPLSMAKSRSRNGALPAGDARRKEPRVRHLGPHASNHLWPVVRATSCNAVGSRVTFMLTSTPLRAGRIGHVLENMRKQSRRPDAVVLAVPRTYARPPLDALPFKLTPGTSADPLLRVVHLERDAGPLTKYLGASALGNASDIVIVGDDDMWYGDTFVEVCYALLGPLPRSTSTRKPRPGHFESSWCVLPSCGRISRVRSLPIPLASSSLPDVTRVASLSALA